MTRDEQIEGFQAFVDAKAKLWMLLFTEAFKPTLERARALCEGAPELDDKLLYARSLRTRKTVLDPLTRALAVASGATDVARELVAILGDGAPESRRHAEHVVRMRADLVRANLRLVFGIARRFKSIHVRFEDMVADGNLGLIKSVDRFDPSFKVQFSTYAVHWIRHEVARGIDDRGRTIRVPVNARIVRAEIAKHRNAAAAVGHVLDDVDLAERMGIRVDRLRQIDRDTSPVLRLDVNPFFNDENPRDEFSDGADLPDDQIVDREQIEHLRAVLPRVQGKLAYVLRHRFGLDGKPELTLAEIGEELGISRERVRQHEMKALQDLKELLEHGRIVTRRVRDARP